MRNILSYQPGAKFSGREILDWASHHAENKTSHMKAGNHILNHFGNIKADRNYCVFSSYRGDHHEIIHKPLVVKA